MALPSARATHEQSPQAVSAVPVGIANANNVTVLRLIGLASQVCALTVDEITGPSRERRFIRARMAIAHLAIKAGFGCSEIGRRMGGRDHSTICNLRDKARVWRGRDPLFDRILRAMERGIAEGKASRPVAVFTLPPPQPEAVTIVTIEGVARPASDLDAIDRADVLMLKQMRAASDNLLRALRQAA